MFRSPRSCLVLGFLLIRSLAAHAETAEGIPTGTCAKISVQVANLAQVPVATLARAEREAGDIFGRAGITIDWQTFTLWRPSAGCPVPLILSINPRGSTQLTPSALAFSVGAVHATIFYDRVEEVEKLGASRAGVLAYAIAHEIGHLLLGPASHSPHGIMRPKWSEKDLKRAANGLQNFTPQQGEAMRLEIVKRVNRQF